MLGLLLL